MHTLVSCVCIYECPPTTPSYLCCLSTASFPNQHHTLVVAHHFHKLLVILPDRKVLPFLQNLPKARRKWPTSVLVYMSLLDFSTARRQRLCAVCLFRFRVACFVLGLTAATCGVDRSSSVSIFSQRLCNLVKIHPITHTTLHCTGSSVYVGESRTFPVHTLLHISPQLSALSLSSYQTGNGN